MRIVPGAVTFPNIDEMTKVSGLIRKKNCRFVYDFPKQMQMFNTVV